MSYLRRSRNFTKDNFNKVAVIKAVRSATGIGLKDAKDAVEDVADSGAIIKLDVVTARGSIDLHECLNVIEANGMVLTNSSQKIEFILESVKQSAIMATKEGEYELSQFLQESLVKYQNLEKERDDDRRKRADEEEIRKFKRREREEKQEQFEHNQRKRWKQESKEGL